MKCMNISALLYPLLILIDISNCFFPRTGKDGNWRTKTHFDITVTGVIRAISKYIKESKGSESIEDFFKDDGEGHTTMFQRIFAVRSAVAETQTERRDTAYIHCHADQILLAHSFVKSCKQKLIARKDNLNEFSKQLGECLYTVQSFYSNTNWIEMFGGVPYEDFGLNDLMEVVNPDEDSCVDMHNYNSECRNNIIVNDKLTSGYHHGRGNTKPAKPLGSTKGKCSHGGPDDDSRKLVARCGINKDSVTSNWSPHHYLHIEAYTVAVQATENFLIANGTGILHYLGEDTFDKLFNVRKRKDVSLAIAIDYTSSMTDDIDAVKKKVIELLTNTVGSKNEPADYVLSLFHDPASYNSKHLYTNGYDMIDHVRKIQTVPGENYDCPELAAAGTLAAIELARRDSALLLFTDADAKDANRLDEVINAAKAKNIAVTSLLTNQCLRRKRGVNDRVKRSTLSFFEQLANATGGAVHETDKNNIGNVLDEVLQEIFPSGEVIIDSYDWVSSLTEDKEIQIDSTVTVLKISVFGADSETDVDVLYSNGTLETYTNGKSTRIYTDSDETIISIQGPPSSNVFLRRQVHKDWKVNITAQSSIKFEVDLLENSDRDVHTLKGSPITGKNYTASATLYNLGNNGSCNNMTLVDLGGIVLDWYVVNQVATEYDTVCTAVISTPSTAFKIKLHGTDDNGYHFVRKSSTIYHTSGFEMHITASSDDAVMGRERVVGYEVANVGTASEIINVKITDTSGFVQGISFKQHEIGPGESVNDTFSVRPTLPSVIFSYTVSVITVSDGARHQSITRTLVVTDVERPDCSVSSTEGVCGLNSLNTANCSLYNWTAMAEVTFSGILLESITSTVGSSVTISHDNITDLLSGPLIIKISGDCCAPSLDINIIDVEGFISQCQLSFSNGETVKSVEVISTPSGSSDNNIHAIIIAMALCVAVVVIAIVIGAVLYFHTAKKRNAIYKFETEDKPDKAKKQKFNVQTLYDKEELSGDL